MADLPDLGDIFDATCQMFTDNISDDHQEVDLTFHGDVNRAKEYAENQIKNQKQKDKRKLKTVVANVIPTPSMESAENKIIKQRRTSSNSSNISIISENYDIRGNSHQLGEKTATFAPDIATGVSSECTSSICSSSVEETRLQYLLRVPSLMQNATNASDYDKLKLVIDDAFTENCYVKTAYVDLCHGRDNLLQVIMTTKMNIPDYYLLYSEPKFYKHCISLKQFSFGSGIKNKLDGNTQLWNPFENKTMIEKMNEDMLKLKQQYDKYMSEDNSCRFVFKAVAFFILNKEMTHFEARIVKSVSLQLFEDKQQKQQEDKQQQQEDKQQQQEEEDK